MEDGVQFPRLLLLGFHPEIHQIHVDAIQSLLSICTGDIERAHGKAIGKDSVDGLGFDEKNVAGSDAN